MNERMSRSYWIDYYGDRHNFSRVYSDYAELKAKVRTAEENEIGRAHV